MPPGGLGTSPRLGVDALDVFLNKTEKRQTTKKKTEKRNNKKRRQTDRAAGGIRNVAEVGGGRVGRLEGHEVGHDHQVVVIAES